MRQDKKSCECLFFFVDEMYACFCNAGTVVCMYDTVFLSRELEFLTFFFPLFLLACKAFFYKVGFSEKQKTKQNHWLLDPPPQTETLHKCRHLLLLAKIVCKPHHKPSWRR
ncbi:hypothetical protein ACB092_05G152300 [Castanea dentata]